MSSYRFPIHEISSVANFQVDFWERKQIFASFFEEDPATLLPRGIRKVPSQKPPEHLSTPGRYCSSKKRLGRQERMFNRPVYNKRCDKTVNPHSSSGSSIRVGVALTLLPF